MARVLIIKPSSLGDIIHAAGAVERIAAAAPGIQLTWVANEPYVPFVRGLPGVDEVLSFPRSRFVAGRFPVFLPEAIAWARQLRGFDVAVDLQGLQRSGLMARLSGAAERFGSRDARELARLHYNRPVEIPIPVRHAIDRLDFLADAVIAQSAVLARARGAEPDVTPPFRLPIPPASAEEAARLLDGAERLVAICPGTRWESKRWPVSRWARLVREMTTELRDVRPVLLGSADERPLAREILSQADVAGTAPLDLVGKGDLWTTAAIMDRAACVVALDSAQLHLAAAVGTPTVSLFGPTDPLRFAPRGDEHRVLRREELTCLACHKRTCPLERRACLPDLEVEPVLEAVRDVLGE
jgi:lipopolysaccharide heptosyltransferase I